MDFKNLVETYILEENTKIKIIRTDSYNEKIVNDINNMINNKMSKNDWRYIGNVYKEDFEDQKFVCLTAAYNDDEYVGFSCFYKIKSLEDGDKTDVSKYVNIVLAIAKEYRGKHISSRMIAKAIPYLKSQNFDTILWTAWKTNSSSINSALSNRFKKLKNLNDGGSICFIKNI